MKVLQELSADDKPIITVLNKIDSLENKSILNYMRLHYPKTVCLSAKTLEGADDLFNLMVEELKKTRKTYVCRIPQSEYALVAEITEKGRILFQDYEDNDVVLRVEVPTDMASRLEKYGKEQ